MGSESKCLLQRRPGWDGSIGIGKTEPEDHSQPQDDGVSVRPSCVHSRTRRQRWICPEWTKLGRRGDASQLVQMAFGISKQAFLQAVGRGHHSNPSFLSSTFIP